MRTDAATVKAVLDNGKGYDTVTATDARNGDQVGYKSDSDPRQLCAYIDFLETSMHQPYRVKLTKSTADRKQGKKAPEDAPFVFELSGLSQPVNGHAPPVTQIVTGDVELAKDAAGNKVRNELLEERLRDLAAENARLRGEVEELEEELEDADEAVNGVPAAPVSYWHTEAGAKLLVENLSPIGRALSDALAAGLRSKFMNGHAPNAGAPGAVPPASASLTEEQRRILVAVENFKASDPDGATIVGGLVDKYAAPTPANDESLAGK